MGSTVWSQVLTHPRSARGYLRCSQQIQYFRGGTRLYVASSLRLVVWLSLVWTKLTPCWVASKSISSSWSAADCRQQATSWWCLKEYRSSSLEEGKSAFSSSRLALWSFIQTSRWMSKRADSLSGARSKFCLHRMKIQLVWRSSWWYHCSWGFASDRPGYSWDASSWAGKTRLQFGHSDRLG